MAQDTTPGSRYRGNPKGHPFGTGFRPSFHALWHLVPLGVVKDLKAFDSAPWTAAAKKSVRVAVIDTPVAHRHPNLAGAIDLGLARDFSVFDTGVFVQHAPEAPEDQASRAWLVGKLGQESDTDLGKAIMAEAGGHDLSRYVPQPYGAHGTAIAGLIGGRPVTVKRRKPAVYDVPPEGGTTGEEGESTTHDLPLPYAGINPFCRIVPISTTAAPDPAMVAAAIAYARLVEAQVVVIAAEWADALDREADPAGWKAVDDALVNLSRRALVFCAAGNIKAGVLSYPASLSRRSPDKGRVWAVTACDEAGTLLSYAPEPLTGHRMLRTLSSEFPRYDREQVRLDPYAARDPELDLPRPDPDYPPRHIIATDPPGQWGYNPTPFEHDPSGDPDGEHFEIGSLFCRFSGTSAATAIAAGLASLAIAMGSVSGEPPKNPEDMLLDVALAQALFGKGPRAEDTDGDGDGDAT